MKQVRKALISVSKKGDTLKRIVENLDKEGVQIYATGGTFDFISSMGVDSLPVESLTKYPSILGGRVKTLHPLVFGGVLARSQVDMEEIAAYGIPCLDLVIVDLYPFSQVAGSTTDHQECIENIDIGGVALIRAAAKNYQDVWVVPSSQFYEAFLEKYIKQQGSSTIEDRKGFAVKAFSLSSRYDEMIAGYLQYGRVSSGTEKIALRYGENPHQTAYFEGDISQVMTQYQGKEISYNNLLDIDAACGLVLELGFDTPVFAIVKHNNCCGVAKSETLLSAYRDALSCDPKSAFGGVFISNKLLTRDVAEEVSAMFYEVLIAPAYEEEALVFLQKKKNRIVIRMNFPALGVGQSKRSALNGFLVQDRDEKTEQIDELRCVTQSKPTLSQKKDMLFALKICKHTKSNAVVLAKDERLFALGVGQTSRIDALEQAIEKAKHFGFDLSGSVLASEAFFPFDDCVKRAQEVGVTAFVQPGGSKGDQQSIDACDQGGSVMCFTGVRHFKH